MTRVAVLGVGLIGGSIGLAARSVYPDDEVRGYDPAPGVIEEAERMGAVSVACDSLEQAVEGAGVCFVCCPVGSLAEVARAALAAAPEGCVVTDVGSTKAGVVAALEGDPGGEPFTRFVGGHPVAGAETAGVQHARADLFKGCVWYLTPTAGSSGVHYERMHRATALMGAQPRAIDPATHDHLLASVSHLPHVLANVLVSQAAAATLDQGEQPPVTGPSLRDATRVAGSNPAIWTDIFLSNREAVAAEVEEHVRRLEVVLAALRDDERESVEGWIAGAREDRRRLIEAELAGGPVRELRISVPNKPGIVAQVALELGRAGVNIVDMALHPAPDWQTGAVTLWIAGEGEATRAEELVQGLGYPVARAEGSAEA